MPRKQGDRYDPQIENQNLLMMKQLFVLAAAFFCANFAFAQSRLGSTADEIREEFSDPTYQLEDGATDGGRPFIRVEMERSSVMYLLDDEDVCALTFIIPEDPGALNGLVEEYNNRYVIISPTEWRMYGDWGYADITLVFPEDGKAYFIWD